MTRKLVLQNVKVDPHGQLSAILIDKEGVEAKEFASMHESMNSHFNNDQMATVVPYHPHAGQICVGQVGTVWHRVRVEATMSLKCGLHASCYLIDEGRNHQIPIPCLRQIPSRFTELPHQVKKMELHGIKPLSLRISAEYLMVYERSVIKWDSSAVKFMGDIIKASVTVKVKIVSCHADGVFSVIMYLYTRNGNRVCLNDALVDQRYAVTYGNDDTPTLPVQKNKPSTFDSLHSLRIANIQNLAIGTLHLDDHAKSDIEQKDMKRPIFERGCITDTEAVSAISHRFLPRMASKLEQQATPNVHARIVDNQSDLSSSISDTKHQIPMSMQSQHSSLTELMNSSAIPSNHKSEDTVCFQYSTSSSLDTSDQQVRKDTSPNGYKSVCDLEKQSLKPGKTSQDHISAIPETSPLHSIGSVSSAIPETSPLHSIGSVSSGLHFGQGLAISNMCDTVSSGQILNRRLPSNSPAQPLGRGTFSSSIQSSPIHSFGRGSPMIGRGVLLKSLSPSGSAQTSPSAFSLNNRVTFTSVNMKANLPHHPTSSCSHTHKESTDPLVQDQRNFKNSEVKLDLSGSDLQQHYVSDEDRGRPRHFQNDSNSPSSCMSAVVASMTGQLHTFTKSKPPRQFDGQDIVSKTSGIASKSFSRTSSDQGLEEKSPSRSPLKGASRQYQTLSDSNTIANTLHRDAWEKSDPNYLFGNGISNSSEKESVLASSRFDNFGLSSDRKTEMFAKFSGEKLLKELSSGVPGVNNYNAQTKRSEAIGMCDNVLVHGKTLKRPVYKIEGFPFKDEVMKHWNGNKFASPKLVQSYGWPVVMSGRHITAISPAGSGKTLTYLYALITYLFGSNMYRELPTGMGPKVIILSKSWRKAKQVNYIVSQVTTGCRAKTLLVYGGGMEENRAFELINGLDILVTTPPSLKRLLEKGYTDLRRLCHLVLDDCDQILDTFHLEINYIKSEYSLVIQKETKQLECPRQILVFGSQWNEVNSQFTENVLNDPILLITSPFEASIYGRVRQVPHPCRNDGRLQELLGLLMNIVDTEHRIIIFSSNEGDIQFLVKGLRAYSYDLIFVTQQMELHNVKLVANDWARGAKLLVCCDTHVMNMEISDASVVISYDLPNSKTKFGNRMSCMRQHFYNFAVRKKRKIEPISHLLITGNCDHQVRTIQELLKRSKVEVPRQLKAFLAGMVEQREADDKKELCYQLLAYGTCRDKWKCGCRHIVIRAIDISAETEWLPNEGHVKVLVTHVNDSDASHFYVRLLNVKGVDGTVLQPALTYARLIIDLECWFKKPENQKRHTDPLTGELCGYQDRGVFYRVQILDIPNMNSHGKGTGGIEVSVKFVDIGKDMDIDVYKLYELPVHLKTVPFQAVEVFVCRVKPVDKDPEWTIKASIYINELLYGKELEGKIVLRLGGILWLDPLVERVYLSESKAIINRSYVHVELVRNGFANENPTHLEKLYKLCEGKVELPRLLLVKTKMSQILQTDSLPLCKQYHDVHVSAVTSPDLFFIQRREKVSELDEMMEAIADYVHELEEDDCCTEMAVGQYCLAKYESFDQRWYRSRVMDVFEDEYKILFADYGDLDNVPKAKVKEFPADKFFEFPLQAIECKLSGVYTDKTNEKKSGDAFWDLTHFINSDLKSLVAKVKSQDGAEIAGRSKFVIDLYDTTGEDLNIAQELIYSHLVNKTQESEFEDLFPHSTGLRRKIYSSPMEKVSDMVAVIYWEPDTKKAFDIALQLVNLIKSSIPRQSQSINRAQTLALHSLIQLIGRVRVFSTEAVVHDCILELISTGDRMCEEFLQSNCLSSVSRCLEMENDTSMQSQAAEFISSLCTTSTRIRNEIQNERNSMLFTLNELFEYTQREQIKGAICKTFSSLCSGSDRVFQYLMEKHVCTKLKTILLDSENHAVQEAVILLLSTLSDHDGSHSDLKKESLIEAIIKNLKSTSCDKCIHHSIEFCAHYASTRRKHKTHLLELEMVSVLKRTIELNIESATKQSCKDLLSSLVVKFPSEPLSGVKHVEERNLGTINREVTPHVHWCQTKWVVQLSIKIPESSSSRESFIFTQQTIKFRETVKGVRYIFLLDLFDQITPCKCKVAVKPTEVLVSLHKHVKGNWARLLSGNQKPNWIFVDYERYVDSSSNSDTYDEERPFVFKKKKKTKKLPTDKSGASAYRVLSSSDTEDSVNYFDDQYEKDEFDIFS